MHPSIHLDIQQRWDETAASESRFRELSEAAVARRAWSGPYDTWHDPRPFASERGGERRGKLQDKRPARARSFIELGFDDAGRSVLALDVERGAIRQATYTAHHAGWADSATFQFADSAAVLARVDRLTYNEQGALAGIDTCHFRLPDESGGSWHPCEWERYAYDPQGRVSQLEIHRPGVIDRRPGVPEHEIVVTTLLVSYDDAGEDPASIREVERDRLVWARPIEGLREATQRVQDGLVERLSEWARARQPQAPVYAFVIGWHVGFPLEPLPALGTVDYRDAHQEDPRDLGHYLWNPAEMPIGGDDPILLPDEFEKDAQHLRQAWGDARTDDGAVEFYAAIAKRLARADYAQWPRNEEFVVISLEVTTEGTDALERQMRASVSVSMVRAFRSRGWLNFD